MAGQSVDIIVPAGHGPGDMLTLELPDGSEIDVETPAGVVAGDVFEIEIEDDDDASGTEQAGSAPEPQAPPMSTFTSKPPAQEQPRTTPMPHRRLHSVQRSENHEYLSMAARRAQADLVRQQREDQELAQAKRRAKVRPVRKSAAHLGEMAERMHLQSKQSDQKIDAKRRQMQTAQNGRMPGRGKKWDPAGEAATRLLKARLDPHEDRRDVDFGSAVAAWGGSLRSSSSESLSSRGSLPGSPRPTGARNVCM